MAKRTTQVTAGVEYIDANNNRRTTQVNAQVEYIDANNNRRTTQVLVMVEYSALTLEMQWGPTLQVIGG